jgi:hypothetical protein
LRRALATFLTLFTVLVCPLICLSGGACPAVTNASIPGESAPTYGGCCCCRHACRTASENADGSTRSRSESDDARFPNDHCNCHCLCEGAVLDHVITPIHLIVAGDFLPAHELPVVTSQSPMAAAAVIMDDHHGASGLSARIALCSLQR